MMAENNAHDFFTESNRLVIFQNRRNYFGPGSFGAIKRGLLIHHGNESTVVVVKFPRRIVKESQILEEAELLCDLGAHPNVLGFYGLCRKRGELCIIVEFSEGGSLPHFFRRNSEIAEGNVILLLGFARDIAEGMCFLERNKVVHRDLSERNVLIGADFCAKLSDFGLATRVPGQVLYTAEYPQVSPIETRLDGVFTAESAIWMFGVLVWKIFTYCEVSFGKVNDHQMDWKGIHCAQLLEQPVDCPDRVDDLVMHCWAINPQQRPKFATLAKHLKSSKLDMTD